MLESRRTCSTTTSRPPALHRKVRPQGDYDRALDLLDRAKEVWAEQHPSAPPLLTKSGIIVGMGETDDEVVATMADLRAHRVDVVTVGQYLQPTARHLPLDRWVTPESFGRSGRRASPWGSARCSPARSCVPAIAPRSSGWRPRAVRERSRTEPHARGTSSTTCGAPGHRPFALSQDHPFLAGRGRPPLPSPRMSDPDFERAVKRALELLPDHLQVAMENVVVLVDEQDSEDPELYGLYTGTPLTERTSEGYAGSLPDTIAIYRRPLQADFGDDPDRLVDEIRITVLHELAHHFGIDEDELDELGFA